MKVVCGPGVAEPVSVVRQSALFDNWARRLRGTKIGEVIVYAVHRWGGEIRMLQLGVEYGKFRHAVFLRGATVDMLTIVTDGRARYIVHVEQPRVAVGQIVRSNPAGMVDTGESAATAALREVTEEVGAHIRWGQAKSMHQAVLGTASPMLVSPGGTDEEVTFYVVEGHLSAAELRRLSSHIGGLASEGERLKLRLMPYERFEAGALLRQLASGRNRPDMKALLSLLLYSRTYILASEQRGRHIGAPVTSWTERVKIRKYHFERNEFAKITSMKSLNLARPQMLLIVGNPGAGKSFFARQFSETFEAPVVSLDRIRFELFANPTYGNDENDLVTRVANYIIEELLKTKRSFVVDGGSNARAERIRLSQLAKKSGYDTPVVWVQTDVTTCRSRALKRNPEKRADDKYNLSLSEQMFDNLVRRFTEPVHEKHVVISGKHTYGTQAKMVLRKLVADREAVAEEAHRHETEQVKQASQRPDVNRRGIVIR